MGVLGSIGSKTSQLIELATKLTIVGVPALHFSARRVGFSPPSHQSPCDPGGGPGPTLRMRWHSRPHRSHIEPHRWSPEPHRSSSESQAPGSPMPSMAFRKPSIALPNPSMAFRAPSLSH
jgi:hypothetical protein